MSCKFSPLHTPRNSIGDGHLMTFVKGHSSIRRVSAFSMDSFSGNSGPISIKSHLQHSGDIGEEVNIFSHGHILKLATLPN